MSPVGGVGINLAIQDAVAAANRLWMPLREGRLTTEHLRLVQRRREWPTRVTQWLQLQAQRRVISPTLGRQNGRLAPPRLLTVLGRHGLLGRLPARLVGVGIRPEHVEAPVLA
jgi:2-polyprenyl-6-methoxyphenol hydroxylase-like FAD-dependent oxidoreductase